MDVVGAAFVLVAASPLWPLLNLVARPRFVSTFPRAVISFGGFIALYLATLGIAAVWCPSTLPWLAAAAVAWNLGLWWRSRDRYGASRRLPPGSLAILPPGPWIDHWHYAGLARIYGPIFKASHFFHPMVCVMNLESGLRLLKEHDDIRLRSPKVAADRFLPCGFMRGMEPENHQVYRKLIQSLITPRVLAAWEPSIGVDVSEALSALERSPDGVYAKPMWDRVLMRSFSRVFFGITPGSDAFRQLEAAFETVALIANRRISVPWLPSERRIERVLADLCHLLRQQTAPECFLAELRRQPEFADSEQALRLLVFMMYLGASDMAGLLQWTMKVACDFPDEVARVRVAVEQSAPGASLGSLCRRFTLETLRRHQVEHLYRRVLEDIEWEGFHIPKGWLLRVCLAEAHRDPAVFSNPAGFEPDRLAPDPPSQSQFLPFGAFRRSCLGEGVTHTFLGQFLRTMVRDWNCRQVGESHEDYRAWHWTPGSDFRFSLEPRRLE